MFKLRQKFINGTFLTQEKENVKNITHQLKRSSANTCALPQSCEQTLINETNEQKAQFLSNNLQKMLNKGEIKLPNEKRIHCNNSPKQKHHTIGFYKLLNKTINNQTKKGKAKPMPKIVGLKVLQWKDDEIIQAYDLNQQLKTNGSIFQQTQVPHRNSNLILCDENHRKRVKTMQQLSKQGQFSRKLGRLHPLITDQGYKYNKLTDDLQHLQINGSQSNRRYQMNNTANNDGIRNYDNSLENSLTNLERAKIINNSPTNMPDFQYPLINFQQRNQSVDLTNSGIKLKNNNILKQRKSMVLGQSKLGGNFVNSNLLQKKISDFYYNQLISAPLKQILIQDKINQQLMSNIQINNKKPSRSKTSMDNANQCNSQNITLNNTINGYYNSQTSQSTEFPAEGIIDSNSLIRKKIDYNQNNKKNLDKYIKISQETQYKDNRSISCNNTYEEIFDINQTTNMQLFQEDLLKRVKKRSIKDEKFLSSLKFGQRRK